MLEAHQVYPVLLWSKTSYGIVLLPKFKMELLVGSFSTELLSPQFHRTGGGSPRCVIFVLGQCFQRHRFSDFFELGQCISQGSGNRPFSSRSQTPCLFQFGKGWTSGNLKLHFQILETVAWSIGDKSSRTEHCACKTVQGWTKDFNWNIRWICVVCVERVITSPIFPPTLNTPINQGSVGDLYMFGTI